MNTVKDFAKNFRILAGDTTMNTPDEFIIAGVNWCLRELPLTPGLGKIFTKHVQGNLDAKGHYKWELNDEFRAISDIPMINFFTSTGGEPCKLNVCYKPNDTFYAKNGLVKLKKAGVPCEYTFEVEGDKTYLVFDRPLDIPIIIDYVIYGFPKPVESMDDKLELSAVAEQLMLMALKTVWYQEADDFAFAGAIYDYLDNKYLPEAIQMLNKRWGAGAPIILGEA